jgi:hypothetical protein
MAVLVLFLALIRVPLYEQYSLGFTADTDDFSTVLDLQKSVFMTSKLEEKLITAEDMKCQLSSTAGWRQVQLKLH